MPAIRLDKSAFSYHPVSNNRVGKVKNGYVNHHPRTTSPRLAESEDTGKSVIYPISTAERKGFRTKGGKGVTSHQWDVYDFVYTIPHGKVSTYKDVSLAVGGSPRSVGSALRNNPFAPYIPCHRVIASNFFVGGFFGEWGTNDKTGTQCNQKLDLLASEGVQFNKTGHLVDVNHVIWRGPTSAES